MSINIATDIIFETSGSNTSHDARGLTTLLKYVML